LQQNPSDSGEDLKSRPQLLFYPLPKLNSSCQRETSIRRSGSLRRLGEDVTKIAFIATTHPAAHARTVSGSKSV
jgi:hypothetical protein